MVTGSIARLPDNRGWSGGAQGGRHPKGLSAHARPVLKCARQRSGGTMAGVNPTAADLGIMTGYPPRADKRITLENWDAPPFNRWSFQNIRSILPTKIIPRGSTPASVFPRAHQNLDSVAFTEIDGSTSTVGAMLDRTYTDAFIFLHRGRIVMERYMNGMSEGSIHLSQS